MHIDVSFSTQKGRKEGEGDKARGMNGKEKREYKLLCRCRFYLREVYVTHPL